MSLASPSAAVLLEIANLVGLLKKTIRTGWVRRGVAGPESVAEHSYRMAMLALFYGPYVDRNEAERTA